MKTTRRFAAALFVAAIAAGAFAALSDTNVQFGNGPAKHLMTREEAAAWKNVKDDAEAQAFINAFWARRDPTPSTPANEFRNEFEGRVKYADEHFTEGRTKGSMTDRGRVFIVMGSPAVVRKSGKPTNAIEPPSSGGIALPQEARPPDLTMIWVYDQAKTKVPLPAPTVQVPFVDQYGNDVWRLDRAPGLDVNAMLQRAAAAGITNPNATGAPTAQATAPQPAPAVATPAPAAATALKSQAFQTAIGDETAGKSTLKKGAVTFTELLSPAGDYYVPVGLFVPKSAGITADAVDTLFGVVRDANGNTVALFEEPAKATVSFGDLLADRTVTLPSGKYTAVFGLAKGDQPVVIASAPLELTTVTKDAGGTSKLILTNNIMETPTAAPPKSPFAFGKLKIIPKGDFAFGNKDDLGYFVEIHNPSIDTGTNLPKMQMRMEITGTVNGKAIPPIAAPMSEASPLPLAGIIGPGQYAIIGSIPLSELKTPLKPGDYMFKMKLVDTISKQTYNLEQPFKIVGQ